MSTPMINQSSEERAREETEYYCDLKVRACQREGGPDDCMPTLTLCFADGKLAVAMMPDGHPTDSLAVAIMALRQQMEGHGAVVHATLAVEGFAKTVPDRAAMGTVQRGDFQKEHDQPGSDVQEVLHVFVYSPLLDTSVSAMTPYVYDDHGQPVFAEAKVMKSAGGAILRIMKQTL